MNVRIILKWYYRYLFVLILHNISIHFEIINFINIMCVIGSLNKWKDFSEFRKKIILRLSYKLRVSR